MTDSFAERYSNSEKEEAMLHSLLHDEKQKRIDIVLEILERLRGSSVSIKPRGDMYPLEFKLCFSSIPSDVKDFFELNPDEAFCLDNLNIEVTFRSTFHIDTYLSGDADILDFIEYFDFDVTDIDTSHFDEKIEFEQNRIKVHQERLDSLLERREKMLKPS